MTNQTTGLPLDVTVVVPTYNRRALLLDLVASLRAQTLSPDRYEIVIISDGSTDGTDETFKEPWRQPVTRLIRQEKRGFGLAAARNLGARHGAGRLVLFIDDDMVADRGLLEAHVGGHAAHPDDLVAICGKVVLSPDLPATPFCQIVIGDTCRLYDDRVDEARFIPPERALSWQTSFKRHAWLDVGGNDDTYRSYGWEDIEFACRAAERGMRFFYTPDAVSFHRDQRVTLEAHADRLLKSSRMAPRLFGRFPRLEHDLPMFADKRPVDWQRDGTGLIGRKLARRALAAAPLLGLLVKMTPWVEGVVSSPAVLRRWYYGVLGGYIVRGYREGLRE